MRLFYALTLDAQTKKRLAKLRETARDYSPDARFTPDENLHLTLVFLGEMPDAEMARRVLTRTRAHMKKEPIRLEFDGTRALGEGILAVGVRKTPELMRLQHALEAALIAEGFTPEKREFLPHVTLARRFSAQGWTPSFAPFSADAERVCLMRSEQTRGGVRYTEIL